MKISGVDSASISKVSGVAKASVSKFSGVALGGEVNTTIANNTYFTPDHYYDFKGDANDQVGSAHGTVMGATGLSDTGILDGGGYDFDGSNDYIKIPKSVIPHGTKDFTAFMTINVDAWTNNPACVFGGAYATAPWIAFTLFYQSSQLKATISPYQLINGAVSTGTNLE